MLRWFESLINPFRHVPPAQPPTGLGAFYWHFLRQVWPMYLAVMVAGFGSALVEVALFVYLGAIVDLLKDASDPASFFANNAPQLAWMAFVAMVARPVVFFVHTMLVNQTIAGPFTSLIRWQTHRHVLRQSLTFFHNDFAGRIATRIMQSSRSLRESVVQASDALWFMVIYTVSAGVIFFDNDWRLTVPLVIWIAAVTGVLAYFVPRIKARSIIAAESRATLMGRIVDSYTNIMTVKLFAHTNREDENAREAIAEQTRKFQDELQMITLMEMSIWCINGILIVSTIGLAIWLWSQGLITIGAIAVAAGLVIRINNMAGWIMFVVTSLFENIGTVQEGAETIAKPHTVVDARDAKPLKVSRGEIVFDNVTFRYGLERGIVEDLSLTVHSGEKVGVVGRSGAGKSTLVNLLLRFYDLEQGRILIDGQDVSRVTQDSLRAQIGMVTQDPSLLHRSIMHNILYGRPEASEAEAIAAAKKAHSHEFILELEDPKGRKGYRARAGERGVKLSGGQRQRIAIARVLLKDAPILILDEATSALDSEVEAAIQEQLYNLMEGKTVIAIAHRLSTIAAMDRLIIMDQGSVVEMGAHTDLVRAKGLYAQLWARQSGGFLAQEAAE